MRKMTGKTKRKCLDCGNEIEGGRHRCYECWYKHQVDRQHRYYKQNSERIKQKQNEYNRRKRAKVGAAIVAGTDFESIPGARPRSSEKHRCPVHLGARAYEQSSLMNLPADRFVAVANKILSGECFYTRA